MFYSFQHCIDGDETSSPTHTCTTMYNHRPTARRVERPHATHEGQDRTGMEGYPGVGPLEVLEVFYDADLAVYVRGYFEYSCTVIAKDFFLFQFHFHAAVYLGSVFRPVLFAFVLEGKWGGMVSN